MSRKELDILKKISIIDDAVLIMDDIFDESKFRNKKLCLYRETSIQNAILTAEILRSESIEILIILMKKLKTSDKNKTRILEKINEFFKCIYLGEKIDLELNSVKEYSPMLIKKYFKMVRLFTGGHIKFGLEIGQLLQNKKIDSKLSKISEHLGTIRQICDDFNDYFDEHHEPFGDFITESNRLPELIFKKLKGNRAKILELTKKKSYPEARVLILNKKTRLELHKYCKQEIKICKKIKTAFDYSPLIENFDQILSK